MCGAPEGLTPGQEDELRQKLAVDNPEYRKPEDLSRRHWSTRCYDDAFGPYVVKPSGFVMMKSYEPIAPEEPAKPKVTAEQLRAKLNDLATSVHALIRERNDWQSIAQKRLLENEAIRCENRIAFGCFFLTALYVLYRLAIG